MYAHDLGQWSSLHFWRSVDLSSAPIYHNFWLRGYAFARPLPFLIYVFSFINLYILYYIIKGVCIVQLINIFVLCDRDEIRNDRWGMRRQTKEDV
jgi:hypothetical protein